MRIHTLGKESAGANKHPHKNNRISRKNPFARIIDFKKKGGIPLRDKGKDQTPCA